MIFHGKIPQETHAFVHIAQKYQCAGTHLYSWVERGTVRLKCFAQEHNTMTRPWLKPGPLDPESSLTC